MRLSLSPSTGVANLDAFECTDVNDENLLQSESTRL